MDPSTESFTAEREATLERYGGEIAGIRTGRVAPDTVSGITVEYYGSRTPLLGLASISNLDARTLVISPWDPGAAGAIAKALTEAQLGVQPIVDRDVIRLSFPEMTAEARERAVKELHKRTEEARVRLRQARDEALRVLKAARDAGDATDDDYYDGRAGLDALISQANDQLEALMKAKEADLNTI
ncbi:MAG: ribosome recycling factor [Candidatus Andersenbacteria bacterium CG10_big_fil_rev_8_21_14_0_10_54_11]|uniref:Ribosome recycling factor n=1 Tax=Candidatus Andersenbacteria bacterium CG10_big_fil_rev_8_21_14_0_10_54_11 TaxID=1974485 RepID=A0A2M6WYK6_9BACT|nr:MAG: ribosome recycling factor [Candidatus Andersenbacteria bacterium CG10_big_fil_rev_8_21_14_0_10_54_11]